MVAYRQADNLDRPRPTEVEFVKIPVDDLTWVMTQKPAVIQLFLECWLSDAYGSRWAQLNTKLKRTAFKQAKKQLSDQGLFIFKPESSIRDGRATVCWLVRNLHGSRVKDFWKEVAPTTSKAAPTTFKAAPTTFKAAPTTFKAAPTTPISPQTPTQQGLQKPSGSPQDRLRIASRTPHGVLEANLEAIIPQETQPPLGGAATNGGMLEVRSPAATQPPPPPQNGMVAQPPLCQGTLRSPLRSALDTESPAALSRDRHEGEGGAVTNCLPVANTCTSAYTPASLEDQAEVTGRAQGDLGRDSFSAAAPPGFQFQVGDEVALDWSGSHHHQRVGVVQKLDLDAREVEVLFDGMGYNLTFPIARVIFAPGAAVEVTAAPPPVPPSAPDPISADLTAALIEEICQLAFANDFPVEEAQKAELSSFTQKQLEVVLKTLQTQIAQFSRRGPTKKERFAYSLTMGRRSSPRDN